MSFDNSRNTFNPWNDYIGVVMQQGRVQLDADWNEWIAEFARRIQAGTLDILGLAGVPASTPFGFKINAYKDPSGNPHITIGTGRMYVDGLMVENRGPAGLAQWDFALAEWSGAPPGATETDVDFTNQPYLPGAIIPGNGPFLVYLDVWQREVTYLEDQNLIDPAVGVDTTGRLQTVWQVKLLDVSSVPAGVSCYTPDANIQSPSINWGSLIHPQARMLTTGLVPPTSSGPCALSPTPGFTGLENQLYRVEIHQGGSTTSTPLATFKWSREDASVSTLVTAISSVTNSIGNGASQLTVQSLGRDQVLGFNPGSWIEIIDDYLELNPPVSNGQAQAGELHQIDSIDPVARTITLDSPVSSTNFPVNSGNQTDPSRHTRIRRWDQAGTVYQSDAATVWSIVDNTGIPLPPPGTALILENGITVSFQGSSFQAGDFWVFAARTADGSVEIFNQPAAAQSQPIATVWNATTAYTPGQIVTNGGIYYICTVANTNQAPPNPSFWTTPLTSPVGTYHHYRRLSIVDFTATPPRVSDCRRVFQPLANSCIHITNILLGSNPLQNDSQITVQALASGITIVCDATINSAVISQSGSHTNNCPICFVTADFPIPTSPPSGGFNPFILSASVTVTANTINWMPTPAAINALLNQLSPGGLPLLVRLTLKGNFIWAQDDPNVYLNGGGLGMASSSGAPINLQLPSGDGRRSADFDLWFWLISQPAVTLSATNVNFINPQLVGSPSNPISVTLTNNSAHPLTFPGSGISVTGANPNDFKVTNTCGTAVAPGASCTISVTFTPTPFTATVGGPRSAQINIQESADTIPLAIMLTGTAIQPQVSTSPTSLVFPSQTVGATSAPQIVTLTNPGSSQLTISSVAIESSDYSLTTACGGSLQAGQQCTISIRFEPTAPGTRPATLLVQTNASNIPGGILNIPLTGTGIAAIPAATVSPTSLSFGIVLTNSSSTRVVTLTSTGTTALLITGIAIAGTAASSFSQSNTCGGSLQSSQQCTITVVFRPATIGLLSATLQLTTNAGLISVPLSGTGEDPKNVTKDNKDAKDLHEKPGGIEKHIQVENTHPEFRSPAVSGEDLNEPGSATKSAFINPAERPPVGPQP
jgi:Family of unknown function (DUF6519)/Abnormal spindle-like microcephaly-assoc'd, ASPM-SPD-2-Hydin